LALEQVHVRERGGVEVRRGDRALGGLAMVHEGRQCSTANVVILPWGRPATSGCRWRFSPLVQRASTARLRFRALRAASTRPAGRKRADLRRQIAPTCP
jgi:hypothetical protein